VNPFSRQLISRADRRAIAPKEWRPITHAEQSAIALACDPLTRDIFVFAISTGLWRGEILGLTWDQIDGDELHFTPEQAKAGRHDLCVMDEEALSIVIRRRAEEYVFHLDGERIRPNVFHRMWALARARAGLKRHVQFHDCRRTLGQRILDATGNIVLAQHPLRHASVRTTERKYAKKPMDLMRDAVRRAAGNTTTRE
jgi:integrase